MVSHGIEPDRCCMTRPLVIVPKRCCALDIIVLRSTLMTASNSRSIFAALFNSGFDQAQSCGTWLHKRERYYPELSIVGAPATFLTCGKP